MNPKHLVIFTLIAGSALLLIGLSSCETTPPSPVASPDYLQKQQQQSPGYPGSRYQDGQGSGYQGSGY